jgi:hypothetical protein
MFPRAPFLLTVAIFASVSLTTLLIITPLPDDFWWANIDPLGYSVYTLRRTRGFALPRFDPALCQTPFRLAGAWRTIAARPNADSIFRHLYLRAHPAGRLYALIGLHQLQANGLPAAIQTARRDTAKVMMWDWRSRRTVFLPLRDLVSEDTLVAWAHVLATPEPAGRCAA